MSEAKLEAYFFTTVFIGVLILTGRLFYPFLGALALALVLATLGMPLYDRFHALFRNESLAALTVVLLMTIAVLVPATFVFFLLVDEVKTITHVATQFDPATLSGQFQLLEQGIRAVFPAYASVDVTELLRSTVQNVGVYMVTILTNTASATFKLFVAIFALFYFLKDGRRFIRAFIELSPLTDTEDAQIVKKLRVVSRSLIRGTLVIGVLQGALTGIGFLIFDIPNPVLWGVVAAIGSLIPSIGTGIVAVPAVTYLLLISHPLAAIGLTAWSVLVVGFSDNIIRPYLIGHAVHIHPLFILLSVLGGIAVFGIAGLLLGPLIFGLLVALSEIYKVKIKEIHRRE